MGRTCPGGNSYAQIDEPRIYHVIRAPQGPTVKHRFHASRPPVQKVHVFELGMRRIENDGIDATILDTPGHKSSCHQLARLIKRIFDSDLGPGVYEYCLQGSRGSISVFANSRPKRQTQNMHMAAGESSQGLGEPLDLLLRLAVVNIPTKLNQLETESKECSATNQEMWIDRRAMPADADAGPKEMSLSVSI